MIEELYLARFIDGEVSINVFKLKNYYTITIQIGNTNLEILELIQIIKKLHTELALTLPIKPLTKEEKEISELIYQMLKILNKRGVH